MVVRAVAVRSVAVLAALVALPGLSGCAPSIGDRVNSSLEESVEAAQDSLWEYRDRLASDPEATIPELSFVQDAREGVWDLEVSRTYTLFALDTTADDATLTLLATGGVETGGGWWYEQRDAAVCFDLTFPRDHESIETTPAACPDVPMLDGFDEVVPLEDLSPRLVVTEEDHPAPVCQCHSGSDCDCPGG